MVVESPPSKNIRPGNPQGRAARQRSWQRGNGRETRASDSDGDRRQNRAAAPKFLDDSSIQSTELNRSRCLARSGSCSQTSRRIPMERGPARNPLR